MAQESTQDAAELRFGVSVRDRVHLADIIRGVKRTSSVLRVQRVKPGI
jgi:GTP pyrophosphokinase